MSTKSTNKISINTRKRAFTFVEVLASLALITFAFSALVSFAAVISEFRRGVEARTMDSTERLLRQAQVLGGIIPGWTDYANEPLKGAAKITLPPAVYGDANRMGDYLTIRYVALDLRDPNRPRSPVVGAAGTYLISLRSGVQEPAGKLRPPTFKFANNTIPSASSFPIRDLIVINTNNPIGTSYFYTVGGTTALDPKTSEHNTWHGQMFTKESYPHIIRVYAYHPNAARWPASDTVSLTLGTNTGAVYLKTLNGTIIAGFDGSKNVAVATAFSFAKTVWLRSEDTLRWDVTDGFSTFFATTKVPTKQSASNGDLFPVSYRDWSPYNVYAQAFPNNAFFFDDVKQPEPFLLKNEATEKVKNAGPVGSF
jgi:hypothetical protein